MAPPLTSCELNGTCTPRRYENYGQPVEQSQAQWNRCASDAYCRPSTPGVTVSVDGQDRKSYDEMVAKIPYNDKNYSQALKASLEQHKPVVAIFGSWEKNNTRGLLQDALPGGGKKDDAIYMYIDPEKCTDPGLKKFAEEQLKGGHNAAVTIVFDVKQDANGNPQPSSYSYRWVGDNKSMVPSFEKAKADAAEIQKNTPYQKKDDTPEPPKDVKEKPKRKGSDDPVLEVPPLDMYKWSGDGKKSEAIAPGVSGQPRPEQPLTPKAEQPSIQPKAEQPATQPKAEQLATQPKAEKPATQPKTEQPATQPKAEQSATQPKAEQPSAQPKAEQPATQPKAEQPQKMEAPKVDAPLTSVQPSDSTRYTLAEFEKLKAAKQIIDGTPDKPGYDETHKKLAASATGLAELLHKKGGPADQKELEAAVKFAGDAEKFRRAEAEILKAALKQLDGIPGTEKTAQEYAARLKANETSLQGLEKQLQNELLTSETKKQVEALKAEQLKAAKKKQASEDALKGQQLASAQSKTQYDTSVKKDNEDRSKWDATVKKEDLRRDGARANLDNQYSKPEDAIKAGSPYELLNPYTANSKMNDQKSAWKGTDTEHRDMANVVETQRMSQWRSLQKEVTEGGRTEDKSSKEKLLYDAVTKAGKPFSTSWDFKLTGDGVIQNHGSMWADRAAETMVATCDKSLDRKIAADTVPLALTNNNVPEYSKLKLLEGLKKLSENGADGKPAITRDQEVTILTRALEEDRKKNFDATGYASSMNYKNQQGFKDGDKRSQVDFQAAVLQRLGELKAVEATDILTASAAHPNATIARAARETLAKIHPTVAELRKDVISDPLLAPADRLKTFDDQFAHPRAEKRSAAVIRAFGSQQIVDAKDPSLNKLASIAESPAEDATVKLAAASVLGKSAVPEARTKALKVAADAYCTPNQIPQYSEAALSILKDVIADKQAATTTLSDGRTVIITRQGDSIIFK
ncbi:MAG TPA: hypothetical protein V6C89_00455 [Drouetiella sp.]|jgi:hypothetical protein